MNNILKQLEEYQNSDYYPFHMPGHKRMNPFSDEANVLSGVYGIDITEIDGFDNLYEAQGILKEAQIEAAKLYGADETFFLVNGSTCGILSAITAVTYKGDKILMARNCHKSVYHAVYLHELEVSYLYPNIVKEYGIADAIDPKSIEQALSKQPEITAVVITSPTYEGVVSDIKQIADITHRYGKILIVDEAHGAHFGFHEYFPENAIRQGADLVIHSVHKTLPAMTQTALLHVKGTRVNKERLRRQLRIFQTSSPSYVFMASIDSCMNIMRTEGQQRLNKLVEYRNEFDKKVSKCKNFEIVQLPVSASYCMKSIELGKIVIIVKNLEITGQQLYTILREKYHLQLEMAADQYVLAILTLMDTHDGIKRLADALLEVDRQCILPENSAKKRNALFCNEGGRIKPPEKIMTIMQTFTQADVNGTEVIPLNKALGRIAADFINLYPPGIPMIVPGEKINKEVMIQIEKYLHMMLNVQGVKDGFVKVVKN